ncbi:hypothetical protein BDY24DRAFT_370914 [Mrakia frigida]|uniref:uncharacterized protein n=1 Tax=Mrakia frigida TaxID=29902 RepID=UPI003FCC1314
MTSSFSAPPSILSDPALTSANLYDQLLQNLPSHNATTTTTTPIPSSPPPPSSSSSFLDALRAATPPFDPSSNFRLTANAGLTHSSTLDPLLDLFHSLSSPLGPSLAPLFEAAWNASPLDTLRIIFHARSIPNGKGDREAFYVGMGWLWQKSPRTFLENLEELVQPRSKRAKKEKKKGEEEFDMVDEEEELLNGDGKKGGDDELDPANARSHGYYCDLPNLLFLATQSALSSGSSSASTVSSLLSPPRATPKNDKHHRRENGQRRLQKWKNDLALKESEPKLFEMVKTERVEKHEREAELAKVDAARERARKKEEARNRVERLYKEDRSYRLLHIRVAKIFATQLQHDLNLIQSSPSSPISLAAKWLPSPGSNLALQTLLPESVAVLLFPNLPPTTASSYLLSALQKTYLSPLRAASQIPERPLSAKACSEVAYPRVPSLAMKRYKRTFLEKDTVRFKEFLIEVKKGNRSISGAALTPASLVAEARRLTHVEKEGGIGDVLGAQWGTLVESVRESGKMGEAIAVADVSGSMFSPTFKDRTSPIDSSIGLSLLLSQIAPEPFNGTFITFSGTPQIVDIDLESDFVEIVQKMERTGWGMNTDFMATFRLILNKSKAASLKPEEMIKRLYVFSDMEFDHAGSYQETHFEIIKREFEAEGYDLPELVFWNLNGTVSKPVTSQTPGVALVSGYSAALLKVFLEGGDYPEDETFLQVDALGNSVEKGSGLDPLVVMQKAIGHESFAGLRVVA